jgi:hypothetical protein
MHCSSHPSALFLLCSFFRNYYTLTLEHGQLVDFLTWDESVKRDLKEWNISKDLAMDRSAWRLAINVPEP